MAQHMRGNEITHKLRLGREADAAEVKYYARLWPGPFNKTPSRCGSHAIKDCECPAQRRGSFKGVLNGVLKGSLILMVRAFIAIWKQQMEPKSKVCGN